MEMTTNTDKTRIKREWSKQAIDLAMKGEWQRATEVNQALLALYPTDVDAKNRLGKAFMELGEYASARQVLAEVVQLAPYNNIARKNLARLEQMESAPVAVKQARKASGAPGLFIAETGKSATTVLQRPTGAGAPGVAPGDPVTLVVKNRSISAWLNEVEYLGKVEARLASRLVRLISGGNRYDAAVVGVNDWGVSVIIREAYRHPSLHSISSFPTSARTERRSLATNGSLNYLDGDGIDVEEEGEVEFVKITDFDGEWDE